jgi:hypothetical protein
VLTLRSRYESRCRSGARPEQTYFKISGILSGNPIDDSLESSGQKLDVEAKLRGYRIFSLFCWSQEVEKQGRKPALVKGIGYKLVARAPAAAPTPVDKNDQAMSLDRHNPFSLQEC